MFECVHVQQYATLTLSYTAIIEIATFTAVDENGRCNNNGIEEQLPHTITDSVIIR